MKIELNDNFLIALKRALQIQPSHSVLTYRQSKNTINDLLLYLEYIRRNALWAKEIENVNNIEITQTRNIDLANLINNEWMLNADLFEKVITSSYRHNIIYYLNYELHKEEFPSKFQTLPNPFEPLILFYEKGYGYRYEIGEMTIGADFVITDLRKSTYLNMNPIVEIDDDSLQKEDELYFKNDMEYINNLSKSIGVKIKCLF